MNAHRAFAQCRLDHLGYGSSVPRLAGTRHDETVPLKKRFYSCACRFFRSDTVI
jgi:hypothetical protein